MLWLAVVLPALPLEVFASRPAPFGVVEERVLVACDAKAKSYGLSPGLSVTQACAVCPSLSLQVRDRLAEAALLENLAVFAYRLSPRVVLKPTGLLIHFTDKMSPVGDPHTLFLKVEEQLQDMGYQAEVAIAPTAAAAWLCASSGTRTVWTKHDAWRTALRSLPLKKLPLAKEVHDACAGLGLSLVGEILDLPRAGLSRRFGLDVVHTLERLMGERPELDVSWVPPSLFKRRLLFSFAIEAEETLLFGIHRVVREWVMVMRSREARVSQFTLDIGCEDRTTHSERFTLVRPERSVQVLMGLMRERLRNWRPSAAITFVSVVAPLDISTEGSLSFWHEEGCHDSGFKELLDRFHARLGRESVRTLSWHPDHRPERSTIEGSWPPLGLPAHMPPFCDRPFWLVDPPISLDVIHHIPQSSGPLRIIVGPERLETGWWDGSVVRDYFIAVNVRNERLWVFRAPDGQWFLQGYFG